MATWVVEIWHPNRSQQDTGGGVAGAASSGAAETKPNRARRSQNDGLLPGERRVSNQTSNFVNERNIKQLLNKSIKQAHNRSKPSEPLKNLSGVFLCFKIFRHLEKYYMILNKEHCQNF